MSKILLFAGTSEGREAADYMASLGIDVTACTATEYGKSIINENEHINVISGRLNEEEMEELIVSGNFQHVADATHPFASEVTDNIKTACKRQGVKYLRLLRDTGEENADCIYVNSFSEAVEVLNKCEGKVLLTTGSKNLDDFSKVTDFRSRFYVRVLPSLEAINKCIDLGYDISHVMCMQGPFSEEFNIASIKETGVKYLVTKETGLAGGYDKKLSACAKTGTTAIVIRAPKEEGISFSQFKSYIKYGFCENRMKEIYLVGAGPGKEEFLTHEASEAVKNCSLVIGSYRMLKCFDLEGKKSVEAVKTEDIISAIENNDDIKIAVVFSGDTGFYSGAQQIADTLDEKTYSIKTISGISSYVYFFNKINKAYSDVQFFSMHGRDFSYVNAVRFNKKIFILLGSEEHISEICRGLTEAGLGEARVYIGENLTYDDEKIESGLARDFINAKSVGLSVIYIENEGFKPKKYSFGLNDDCFIRSSVPMTKSEVRSVSMSKLGLDEGSIVYDIGAGTGSVSIECALASYGGHVYSIEKNPEAINCIKRNKEKFYISNISVIEGSAPEAIKDLPAPTHCFIGGSDGLIREIVKAVLDKNPKTRFVINAITLENMFESKKYAEEICVKDLEIVNVSISRSKTVKDLNLMMGLNPVFIVSFTGNGEKL